MPFLERPDGARLYHEVHGPPNAPPLVLLEGMGGDVAGWRRNLPRLAQRHRVVAWDLRGNGRSTMPDRPVTMTTFVDDTLALMDELGISRAHVYGQSFGGMIGQQLVIDHPERVRSLILAATHAGTARVVPVPPGRGHVPKDRPWEALYAPGFSDAHPDHVDDDLRSGSAQDPRSRRRQWEAIQRFDPWEALPSIAVPVLVLHGSRDRMIDPANARLLAERIPSAELALLDAGHVYHSERPDEADRLVLDFLAHHEGNEDA